MRLLVILLIFAVIASLFAGLFFIYRDKGNSNRAVISLTIRVALQFLVIAILFASFWFGLIPGRSQ
jgi:uncharacterized membrane protein YozB (DUF420 family)